MISEWLEKLCGLMMVIIYSFYMKINQKDKKHLTTPTLLIKIENDYISG